MCTSVGLINVFLPTFHPNDVGVLCDFPLLCTVLITHQNKR